jgi:HKD family nuclease
MPILDEIVMIIDYITTHGNNIMFNNMIDIVGQFVKKCKYGVKEGKVFNGLKVCMLSHKILLLLSKKLSPTLK